MTALMLNTYNELYKVKVTNFLNYLKISAPDFSRAFSR